MAASFHSTPAPIRSDGKILDSQSKFPGGKELSRVDEKRICQCISPRVYWYIAWLLVFITIAGSGFFTILYSFNYGQDVTVSWLKSVCVSFTIDVLLEQPFKAIVLAVCLSLWFRRPDDDEDFLTLRNWQPGKHF